jgi:hypothetical protein
MTTPHHKSERVTAQLTRVESLLASCNPFDAADTAAVALQLRELGGTFQEAKSVHRAALCDLARALVEQISLHGVLGPRDAVELVRQAVARAKSDAGAAPPVEDISTRLEDPRGAVPDPTHLTPNPGPTLSVEGANASLQLIDSRKLGEILVSLSMLTPTQVERALKMQRASGRRFGEALVELDLISKDALRSVLKLQKRRSDPRSNEPWSKR